MYLVCSANWPSPTSEPSYPTSESFSSSILLKAPRSKRVEFEWYYTPSILVSSTSPKTSPNYETSFNNYKRSPDNYNSQMLRSALYPDETLSSSYQNSGDVYNSQGSLSNNQYNQKLIRIESNKELRGRMPVLTKKEEPSSNSFTSTLTIDRVLPVHSGLYQCRVLVTFEDGQQTASESVRMRVEVVSQSGTKKVVVIFQNYYYIYSNILLCDVDTIFSMHEHIF